MMMAKRLLPLAALAVAGTHAMTAAAEEVALRAVSAFAPGTAFSADFERFIERVNEAGKGVIQIEYVGGGGAVMNPFELGNAVQGGVVDIGNLPGAYYTNLLPEVDAIKLSELTAPEQRENGAWEYMNQLHMEKMNAYDLARQKDCVPFHLYLNKEIDGPDLSGLNIRVTPIYRDFFAALGASNVQTAPGEVYTALERGTVVGYGWPTQGVLDLGWHEVTKYRVDPGFYRVAVDVLVNLDKWNSLTDEQKGVLQEAGSWLESLCQADLELNEAEKQRQAEAGIEAITLSKEDAQEYLETAQQAGWAAVIEANPEHGPKLKELLTKN
jgi:TRAP-type C4-dicarboxylate transport system substrate-binding protein